MLIDEIKKANVAAMKARDSVAKGIYSIIMNKYLLLQVERREKGLTAEDADMISIIQKTIKELEEEKNAYASAGREEKANDIQHQIDTIKQYLPAMMSEEEIRNEIAKLEDKSIPSVMKHFKTNFAGKADMGLVNRIAKSL